MINLLCFKSNKQNAQKERQNQIHRKETTLTGKKKKHPNYASPHQLKDNKTITV
jgi:hypothetical protein